MGDYYTNDGLSSSTAIQNAWAMVNPRAPIQYKDILLV